MTNLYSTISDVNVANFDVFFNFHGYNDDVRQKENGCRSRRF